MLGRNLTEVNFRNHLSSSKKRVFNNYTLSITQLNKQKIIKLFFIDTHLSLIAIILV